MPAEACSKVELCASLSATTTCRMHRVQDQIARRWQGVRQQIAGGPVLTRLVARKRELILAVLLTAFFLTGAVSALQALFGLVLVAIWAAFWPAEDPLGGSKPRGLSTSDDRLWR